MQGSVWTIKKEKKKQREKEKQLQGEGGKRHRFQTKKEGEIPELRQPQPEAPKERKEGDR